MFGGIAGWGSDRIVYATRDGSVLLFDAESARLAGQFSLHPSAPRTSQVTACAVDIDGTTTGITVRESNPGDMFADAAIRAVEGWEFEPVIEHGVAIQKRAAVRMMFAIE